jgi:hypothetical protein
MTSGLLGGAGKSLKFTGYREFDRDILPRECTPVAKIKALSGRLSKPMITTKSDFLMGIGADIFSDVYDRSPNNKLVLFQYSFASC